MFDVLLSVNAIQTFCNIKKVSALSNNNNVSLIHFKMFHFHFIQQVFAIPKFRLIYASISTAMRLYTHSLEVFIFCLKNSAIFVTILTLFYPSLNAVNTSPIKCPFIGPYSFSYSKGINECKDPLSEIDECTDDKRLLLKFKACADIYGSESRGMKIVV